MKRVTLALALALCSTTAYAADPWEDSKWDVRCFTENTVTEETSCQATKRGWKLHPQGGISGYPVIPIYVSFFKGRKTPFISVGGAEDLRTPPRRITWRFDRGKPVEHFYCCAWPGLIEQMSKASMVRIQYYEGYDTEPRYVHVELAGFNEAYAELKAMWAKRRGK